MEQVVIVGTGTVAWIIPRDKGSTYRKDEIVFSEPEEWSHTEEDPDNPGDYIRKKIRKVVIFDAA